MNFTTDENDDKILLSGQDYQVMMEWEKPYMEESINFLSPSGHVLEIGFGCGYSATQIVKHPIKSYTIIECEPIVIEQIKEWKKEYDTPIEIVEGTWQEKLHTLGVFDEIYFDDYPLNLNKDSEQLDILISRGRLSIFVALCIQNHTKIGSRISYYSNGNLQNKLGSDIDPFVTKEYKTIDIKIPSNCKYRNLSEQQCTIPLITKIKDYNFQEANKII